MDNNVETGEELNQLARLLFNSAANSWYGAVGIEISAGVLAAILSLLDLSGDIALVSALIGATLLISSYLLRLQFDVQYETAETMRRQSVLTEALNWPVGRIQMSDWRQQAGKYIRSQLKIKPRNPDFYATKKNVGAGKLADMTIESAFYTRHLYVKLRFWVWIIFIVAILVSVLAMSVALTKTIPDDIDIIIARVIYSIIPVIISVNFLGWGLKLGRLISAILNVEMGLEQLHATNQELPQVMRLVSEYNCHVTTGIPIHNWLYEKWSPEITDLWKQR